MVPYLPRLLTWWDAIWISLIPAVTMLLVSWWLWRPGRKISAWDPLWWAIPTQLVIYFWLVPLVGLAIYSPSVAEEQLARSIRQTFFLMGIAGVFVTLCRVTWRHPANVNRGLAATIPTLLITLAAIPIVFDPCVPTPSWWRSVCRNNLRRIGIALQNYDYECDELPTPAAGTPAVSWRVKLLPYLDERKVYDKYNQKLAWDEGTNWALRESEVSPLVCPARKGMYQATGVGSPFPRWTTYTSYLLPVGQKGLFSADTPRRLHDVADGASNTIMVLEACGSNVIWSEPRDMDVDTTPIGINLPGPATWLSNGILSSPHWRGGANVALVDGSVRMLGPDTSPELVRQLLNPQDALPRSGDW